MNIDDLISDGFTCKFARLYQEIIERENNSTLFEKDYVQWAHMHGFFAESACVYGLNEDNIDNYLPDYVIYKLWPLDEWTRIWINDKLTLKYLLSNTSLSGFMPKYYYYTSPNGLRSLIDNPNKGNKGIDFLNTIRKIGSFACKPCNGQTAIGFFRMSCVDGKVLADGIEINESNIEDFLSQHINYVFQEYLVPNKEFIKYSPQIHTLRIVTLNPHGNDPMILGGYLRIPNNGNGESNYTILNGSSTDEYNLYVDVDIENGVFQGGWKVYVNQLIKCDAHPDNGIPLQGSIPHYDELKSIVLNVAERFNTLEIMGFDIGITDEGFKCMEINSFPGIKYMQIVKPLMVNPVFKSYIEERLKQIDSLSIEQKKKRSNIIR